MYVKNINENMEDVAEPKVISRSKICPGFFREWFLWFEINGKYRLQASKLVQILLGLLAIFVTTTLYHHYRICILEADRDSFLSQLSKTREEIQEIRRYIGLSGNTNTMTETLAWTPTFQTDVNEDEDDHISADTQSQSSTTSSIFRPKREILTKKNETNPFREERPFDSNSNESSIKSAADELNISMPFESRANRNRKIRVREIGNISMDTGEGRKKGVNVHLRMKKLKTKLKSCRHRCKSILATDKPKTKASSFNEPRAVYIIPTAPNVDITKAQQRIGPWYIAKNGNDFGFSDLWYNGITLDTNRTSIVFKESGLFLVYAQVYYHITLGHNEDAVPMGYRIYLKKNDQNKLFRRPIPIAECVPSYPTTFYQTCFTQVAWYLDAGDQIYLEHFTKSFPMIEADSQGKTFVGIVKLSGSR